MCIAENSKPTLSGIRYLVSGILLESFNPQLTLWQNSCRYPFFPIVMKKIMLLACLLAGKFALSQSTPKADPGISYSIQKTAVTPKPAVTILPGSSQNRTELMLKGFKEGSVVLSILNQEEKLMKQEERFLISGEEQLSTMYLLPKGVYYLLVAQNDVKVKQKLLVH